MLERAVDTRGHLVGGMSNVVRRGAVLAFDFGERRIGVAVGDAALGIAHPVTTLHAESNADRLAAVALLVKEWQPVQFVVGEPCFDDAATPHPVAHLARKFGNRLREQFKLPVVYVNETLSSSEAASQLAAQGVRGREQKAMIDAAAAQVILQSYFDARTIHPYPQQTDNT
jgi:putative holliday junction resolvase